MLAVSPADYDALGNNSSEMGCLMSGLPQEVCTVGDRKRMRKWGVS